jgi:RNA polymerase sigma-70 factor (ECF subfamily)
MDESELLLVALLREGGPRADAACQELVNRYQGRIYSFIARQIYNDEAAREDVLQNTFLGFVRSLPNFNANMGIQNWLFQIAQHKITDHLRKGSSASQSKLSYTEEHLLGTPDQRMRRASSLAMSQERKDLETTALTRVLRDLVQEYRIKKDYKRLKVIELLFVAGWRNKDVAVYLKMSEQDVANYRFAAVKKIKEALQSAKLSTDHFPELIAE